MNLQTMIVSQSNVLPGDYVESANGNVLDRVEYTIDAHLPEDLETSDGAKIVTMVKTAGFSNLVALVGTEPNPMMKPEAQDLPRFRCVVVYRPVETK